MTNVSNPACTPCFSGSYSTVIGATSIDTCELCIAGTYSTSIGANMANLCLSCPAGTYSSTKGANSLSFCFACPAGTFQPITGANSSAYCINCYPGTSSVALGAPSNATCGKCALGTSSIAGAQACTPCPAGAFANVLVSCIFYFLHFGLGYPTMHSLWKRKIFNAFCGCYASKLQSMFRRHIFTKRSIHLLLALHTRLLCQPNRIIFLYSMCSWLLFSIVR